MDSPLSSSRPLEIYVLPFLSPGHMIPLSEIARLFAARGEHVTIITTPSNVALTPDKEQNASIRIHTIPFPAKEVGLPDGLENFFSVKDIDTAAKVFTGMQLLRNSIEEYVTEHRPDCLVSDMFFPWTADLAIRLDIPRLVFNATCMFSQVLKDAVRRPDSPHLTVKSDYDPFVIAGLPHPITMTRAELPDYVRTPNGYTKMMEEWKEAELKSYGVLVNNYYEFDSAYTDFYQKMVAPTQKIINVGPAALIHRSGNEKVKRGHKTVVGEHECLSWLKSKDPNSVLYVCFGSGCIFPDAQLMEIACGLMAAGHDFMWVVLGKDDEKKEDEVNWLPLDFDEKMIKTNKGMIVKGWAPQVLILDHPSVGGFLSHCGWNSVIEAVSAGIPMATWPLYAEHFYNEKLLTQVLGIGVEVGAEEWNLWVDAGKKVIKREKIERAVNKIMDGGDGSKDMRRKTKEMGERAKKAVGEGGSSQRNVTVLIEDLRKLREKREKA